MNNRMTQLINKLTEYNKAYFNQNNNLVSDREYDELFNELLELEDKTGILLSNSPTQNAGIQSVSKLQKVKHDHKLLSLAKTTDMDMFKAYFSDRAMLLMAKMDGITCSLTYENGRLAKAETRGNGEVGEDILHNAMMFSNLPVKIPYTGHLCVDGEAIIDYKTFEKINELESIKYKNPRNLVSGSVRQLDNSIVAKRNIKFVAWKLYDIEKPECRNSFSDRLKFLHTVLGFNVVPYQLMSESQRRDNHFYNICVKDIEELCRFLSYPIDGFVGTFDDTNYGSSLGETGHHPKHSFAYKFYQDRNETTLTGIGWNTTRTGVINPVAVFDPVEIDGTTVSRASLSNVSIIKELQLGIGDTIKVIKANQIIPQIVENMTRSNSYQIPMFCPSCGSKADIVSDNGRERLVCSNLNCPAVLVDRIVNFASRDAMNIEGLSVETINAFVEVGIIQDFESVYHISKYEEQIKSMVGFGEDSVNKLLAAIEKSRNCELKNFMVAIGIPGIGRSTAGQIADYIESNYANLDDFLSDLDSRYKELIQLDGIGEKTSKSIVDYFKKYSDDISKLTHELNISGSETTLNKNNDLSGVTFCITGSLNTFSNRRELENEIKSRGGKLASSVSKELDFLICNDGDSSGSKTTKAKNLGVKIVPESFLLERKE